MPMTVELLKGFAPQSLRDALPSYGKEHPSVIAKYTGEYDAYVPTTNYEYDVVTKCDRPQEKTSMFRTCATRSPAGQFRCFKVMAPDPASNFSGLQLRSRTNMESAFPNADK